MKIGSLVVAITCGAICLAGVGTAQGHIAKVISDDGLSGDQFGSAVSISGGTMLVGAPYVEVTDDLQGAVYVFERDDNGTPDILQDDLWVQVDKLLASDAGYQHYFGASLSMEADTAFIGARHASGMEAHTGAVYVFERDDLGTPNNPFDDAWIETKKIISSDGESGDEFKRAWSNGNTLLVGAPGDDDLNLNAGAVYVFERDENGTPANRFDDDWIEVTKFTADDSVSGAFGGVVGFGNTAVVGARFSSGTVPDSGAAYVFERDDKGTPGDPFDDTWTQTKKLTASDAGRSDNFGSSLSIFGNTILVGAFGEDSSHHNRGAAYVFERDEAGTPGNPFDDDWVETGKLLASDVASNANFGISVFVGDGIALVGGNNAPDGIGGNTGAAYLFLRENRCSPDDPFDDVWLHVGKLTAPDAPAPNFGVSPRISGDVAVAASLDAQGNSGNTGAVYVYDMSDFDSLQQYCIDFELEDDDVTPLFNGQDVSPSEEYGLRCSVGGTSSAGLSSAIFDSRPLGLNAMSDDLDLLVDLGNVLIAQELAGQSWPGYYDIPDDDRYGGDFVIEFLGSPVRVLSIDLIDIDALPSQDATVVLVDHFDRERTFFVPSGWTEDIAFDGPPGYGTLELGNLQNQSGFMAFATSTEDPGFDPASVVSMCVHFDGSAALDNVRYCVEPAEEPRVRGLMRHAPLRPSRSPR